MSKERTFAQELAAFWRQWVIGPLFAMALVLGIIASFFLAKQMPDLAQSFGWMALLSAILAGLALTLYYAGKLLRPGTHKALHL